MMLPGRQRLAEQHGVALGTIERAVATLISEGLLRADDRRGTFVAAGSVDAPSRSVRSGLPTHNRRSLTATVGIIAPIVSYKSQSVFESQWPIQMLRGTEHALAVEPGITTRLMSSVESSQGESGVAGAVSRLLASQVDAVILLQIPPDPECMAQLAAANVPVVAATPERLNYVVPHVYIDDEAAGALAARHLIERGYTRLVFFRPFESEWTEQRLAGVRSALAGMGCPADMLQILPACSRGRAGHEGEQRRVARDCAQEVIGGGGWGRGAGVIAPNDAAAAGFMEVAAARGWVAGRDYGLVGFDDRTAHELGLTSLRPPVGTLGEEAARLVLMALRGETLPARVALQHRLMARSSTSRSSGKHQEEGAP
jgi:LacI family transcriptional regulator